MRANDIRSTEAIRHGAYVCLSVPPNAQPLAAATAVQDLADRLGLRNEFEPGDDHPTEAIAFLRRVDATPTDPADDATPTDLADDDLLRTDAIVHVASATARPVEAFCTELVRGLGPAVKARVLAGVVRPLSFTGNAMFNYSYAHRVVQQPGTVMPNAFLVPLGKTADWWHKGWMERHTYFLPRYDDNGHMLNMGHALAAEAGIACLMRRTYKHPTEPAPPGTYDFLTYFECADQDVSTFHTVCAALRDTTQNPEWKFVREGPTWQGRRVATWAELFT
jgi:hypothetical protein